SGLYRMPGLERAREVRVRTPFGEPSDRFMIGTLGDVGVAFLPRHGRGHRISPSEINSRANVHALKQLGVEFLVSIGAVGSLKPGIRPGDIVIVDQFIDRTHRRPTTFFGDGIVAHVAFADPVCTVLSRLAIAAAQSSGATVHERGTYVCMEGPQFSTRAESNLHRGWNADLIGMTQAPEAKLAREAEICFAAVALVTDYDCWNTEAGDLEIAEILRILEESTARAQAIVGAVAGRLPELRACPCASALGTAILTDRAAIPAATRRRLEPIVARHLGGKA
ncbi:MAG: S-methyl-5'-thioadenosine phosphorylase, partial [Candidatus Binatia bacterium]